MSSDRSRPSNSSAPRRVKELRLNEFETSASGSPAAAPTRSRAGRAQPADERLHAPSRLNWRLIHQRCILTAFVKRCLPRETLGERFVSQSPDVSLCTLCQRVADPALFWIPSCGTSRLTGALAPAPALERFARELLGRASPCCTPCCADHGCHLHQVVSLHPVHDVHVRVVGARVVLEPILHELEAGEPGVVESTVVGASDTDCGVRRRHAAGRFSGLTSARTDGQRLAKLPCIQTPRIFPVPLSRL